MDEPGMQPHQQDARGREAPGKTTHVRIEGDPTLWEVLFRGEVTLILIDRSVRFEQEIALLEQQLAAAQRRLSEAHQAHGDPSS